MFSLGCEVDVKYFSGKKEEDFASPARRALSDVPDQSSLG